VARERSSLSQRTSCVNLKEILLIIDRVNIRVATRRADMSKHHATIKWQRTSEEFTYQSYNREHLWVFANGQELECSAATAYLGKPGYVDPEQAYVASLSSCHMLTFLAICAQKGYVLDSYEDPAEGILAKNEQGQMAITKVTLKPSVRFSSAHDAPHAAELEELHAKAHHGCFIANSVKTEIIVES